MNKLNTNLMIATVGVLTVNVLLMALKMKGLEKSMDSMIKVIADDISRA